MGFFDEDSLEMLEVYLLETRQLTGQLSEALLDAEKNNSFSEEGIRSIFRIMHTIKSSSAMMGLSEMSSMAHKMEDLFAYYREEYGRIDKPDTELFDLLFGVSDFIEKELKRMTRDDYQPEDTGAIIQMIEERLKTITSQEKKKTKEEDGPEEEKDVWSLFSERAGILVRVNFEPGCRMENVRAFMLIRQISSLCTNVETYPREPEKSQESAEYINSNGFLIRFESEDKNAVLESLGRGLFLKKYEILAEQPVLAKEPEVEQFPQSKKQENEKESPQKAESDSKEAEFLNVRMDRLDRLQNLAGEMMIQIMTLENQLEQHGLTELKEGNAHQISRLVGEVERTVMEMRMIPVSRIIPKLKRIMRDICRDQKKEADFVINCGDIEADKGVVDYISEALMHVLRNAVDHGLESAEERVAAGKDPKGKIVFTVDSTVGELVITIGDDGRGLEEEKIRERARERGLFSKPESEYTSQELFEMILQPGFTTNHAVTEYSGRGVGLDVVKKIMDDVGGHLYISSEKGCGSSFTLSVPLTLATMECIRFRVENCRFSLPARYVFHFLKYREHKKNIRILAGKEYILYENRMIPMLDLRKFYCLGGTIPENSILIYVKGNEKEGCILVDFMYEQKRIVIKPLPAMAGNNFRRRTGISGCSIMGTGKICSALDTEILIRLFEKEGVYGK